MTHQFEEKTFHKWTFCDHCNKVLWGVVKQGVECADCGFISHKKCMGSVKFSCDGAVTPIDSDDATLVRGSVPDLRVVSDSEMSVKRTPSRKDNERLQKATTFVQDLIVNTAAKSVKLERQMTHPELSLAANGRNFARFTVRAGALADFQDAIEGVLMWKQPSVTLCCMLAYSLFCLFPWLLIMAPFALLTNLIICNFYYRAQRMALANGKPLPSESSPIAKVGSSRYKRNLTFIQNSMGMFADTFDAVRMHHTHIDWSDEQHTMRIFKGVLIVWIATAITLLIVPWNYLLLVGGLFAFVANTAIVHALGDMIVPKLLQHIQ